MWEIAIYKRKQTQVYKRMGKRNLQMKSYVRVYEHTGKIQFKNEGGPEFAK
jgi:hypothetical protein